ncbi:MAG TPA: FGGY family carbohydrate kinase [Caulobacteraceae bacterium]|jgi:glycerol kinase
MSELILAIDVGTTSTRAAVTAPDGRFVGLASAPLTSRSPGPGRVEQDAEAVWRATLDAVQRALADAGRAASDIAAIGVTTQRASAVVWDRTTGAPLSPLVVWSDLRGAQRASELAAAGFMLAPQQAATKLESLFAAVEAPSSRLAWGNIDSYVIFRLTAGGGHVTDRSQAWPCGYLALPDFSWNARLIEHQRLDPGTFPALVDTWGEIGPTAGAVFGAQVPITADIADQQSALLAHGGEAGTAKFTFGTSGTFDLATGGTFLFPGPATPPLIVSSVAGDTRFCLEGMVLSAGSAVDWLRQAFTLGDHAAFEGLAGSVADAAGAAFLPAMQGLGAPHGDPRRRASLTGLTASVGRAHLARAAFEGVAFRAREIVDHIYAVTDFAPPSALGVDGGLSRSRVFLQILADLGGRPVRRHATVEATMLGAALSAGRGAGLLTGEDAAEMIRFESAIEPKIRTDEAEARFAAWREQVYGSSP